MKIFGARYPSAVHAIVFAALVLGAFGVSPSIARAQLYTANADAFDDDALEALSTLKQAEPAFSRQLTRFFGPLCSAGLTLDPIGWRCAGQTVVQGYWRDRAAYSIEPRYWGTYGVWVCARAAAERCGATHTILAMLLDRDRPGYLAGNMRVLVDGASHGVDAMAFFATAREARDPQTDESFLAALQAAPADSGQNETLRRVQVQAEAALGAGRTIDAARLFRDTLRTTPAWGDGHYNLGLVYGELQLYPEAITEMRRYLYLTPSAPDARAVQDQIYQWEALLSAR